jgi:hypothetical protein
MAFEVHNEKLSLGFSFRMIPVLGVTFDMGGDGL